MTLNVYITKQCSSLLQLSPSLLLRRRTLIAEGWGAVEEQLKEGIVWDDCFLLCCEIQCQVLWKGLFTQLVKLLFTHSHTSSHRWQLSALGPMFPHCLLENCASRFLCGR